MGKQRLLLRIGVNGLIYGMVCGMLAYVLGLELFLFLSWNQTWGNIISLLTGGVIEKIFHMTVMIAQSL